MAASRDRKTQDSKRPEIFFEIDFLRYVTEDFFVRLYNAGPKSTSFSAQDARRLVVKISPIFDTKKVVCSEQKFFFHFHENDAQIARITSSPSRSDRVLTAGNLVVH